MANIIFRLSNKIDKITGKSEILIRFYAGRGLDFRAKSGLYIHGGYWDERNGKAKIPTTRANSPEKQELIKELLNLNAELSSLSKDIRESFMIADRTSISSEWLNNLIIEREKGKHNIDFLTNSAESATDSFFNTFEHFISIQKVSDSRIRHYRVIMRSLKRFNEYYDKNLSFETITPDTLREYASFLRNEYRFVSYDGKGTPYINDPLYKLVYQAIPECRLPKQRGENTIVGTMTRFHTYIKWAVKRGYLQRDPFDDYSIGTAIYGTPFFLTKEERNQLYKATFPNNPGLDVQRDIFVFQCFIGCRVGDLMKMKKDNVINDAIEYIPRKGKDGRPIVVRVPLSPTAKEILRRYPHTKNNRLLPFICEQDYNRDIKKMLKLAGIDRTVTTLNSLTREEEKHPIWEVASSHMARRVLIGNLYKELKDPNLIAKLSGHVENSKAFNRYRMIDEDIARETILKLE